ncbi:transcriptional regulator [Streptomyces sp. SBC-4]|nr:transcriptional regulator [Streptomyces sp. SBC-4]MDV5145451.1 transcriptional regulator [Streptomyces sp. SBC-4]
MSSAVDCKTIDSQESGPAARLAHQLTALLPGVAAVHVRLQDPRTPWPHIRLTATDTREQHVPISRAKALTLARWIMRTLPEAKWSSARGVTFDLRTAQILGREA